MKCRVRVRGMYNSVMYCKIIDNVIVTKYKTNGGNAIVGVARALFPLVPPRTMGGT